MEEDTNSVEPTQTIMPPDDSFLDSGTLSSLFGSFLAANIKNYIQPSNTYTNERSLAPPETGNNSLQFLYSSILETNNSIKNLSTGINSVQKSLSDYYSVDRQQLINQQNRERELINYNLKSGVEGILESKLKDSIEKPIDSIIPKVDNLFSSISSSITGLLGGVFSSGFAENIEKSTDKNLSDLLESKKNIANEFNVSYDVISDIKTGFQLFNNKLNDVVNDVKNFVSEFDLVKLFFPTANPPNPTPDPSDQTPPGDNPEDGNNSSPQQKTANFFNSAAEKGKDLLDSITGKNKEQSSESSSPASKPLSTALPTTTETKLDVPAQAPAAPSLPANEPKNIQDTNTIQELPRIIPQQSPIPRDFESTPPTEIGTVQNQMPVPQKIKETETSGNPYLTNTINTSNFNNSALNVSFNSKDASELLLDNSKNISYSNIDFVNNLDKEYILNVDRRLPQINTPVQPTVITKIDNSKNIIQSKGSTIPPINERIPTISTKDSSPYSWLALSIYNVTPDLG
jgi:hypothetical protein